MIKHVQAAALEGAFYAWVLGVLCGFAVAYADTTRPAAVKTTESTGTTPAAGVHSYVEWKPFMRVMSR